MISSGTLREKVSIQIALQDRNALGEPVDTWAEVATRWASVEAVAYSERDRMARISGTTSYTVRMRFLDGLTAEMRLIWTSRSNRVLYISSIIEKNNREEHELTCEEVAV